MQYVFIIGTGRSGTNLIRRILSYSKNLIQVNETHFLYTIARMSKITTPEEYIEIAYNHFDSTGNKRWINDLIQETNLTFGQFYDLFVDECRNNEANTIKELTDIFFKLCFNSTNLIIVDKTPTYGLVASELSNIFPSAEFVHIIRDGRFAATSMKKHYGFIKLINAGFPVDVSTYSYLNAQKDFPTYDVTLETAVNFWSIMIQRIKDQLHSVESQRVLELKYENIILDPNNSIDRLNNFLNIQPNFLQKFMMKNIARPDSLQKSFMRLDEKKYKTFTKKHKDILKSLDYPLDYSTHLKSTIVPSKTTVRQLKYKIVFFIYRVLKKLNIRIK